jgi:hypothetical protein
MAFVAPLSEAAMNTTRFPGEAVYTGLGVTVVATVAAGVCTGGVPDVHPGIAATRMSRHTIPVRRGRDVREGIWFTCFRKGIDPYLYKAFDLYSNFVKLYKLVNIMLFGYRSGKYRR